MMRRLILALLLLIAPSYVVVTASTSYAAVAFDSASSADVGAVVASTLGWTHTVNSNTNGILIVGVSWMDSGAGGGGISISGITYNGVSLTFLAQKITAINTQIAEMWYLVAPSTGANTVTITWSATGADAVGGAMSFTGVDPVTPLGTPVTAVGTVSPVTRNVTGTSANNMVVDSVGVFKGTSADALAVGAGQTSRYNRATTVPLTAVIGAGSHETSTAGTVTMSWTESVNREWASVVVELKEYTAPAITNHFLSILGVGG